MEGINRYDWEAETAEGEVIARGGDLRGCVRVSLIPQVPALPRHDIVGVPLRRRFCRGFIQNYFSQKFTLPGLFFWEDRSSVVMVDTDLTETLKAGDVIGKGIKGDAWYRVRQVLPDRVSLARPYKGKTKAAGFLGRQLVGADQQKRYYMHCIETAHSRIWVNGATGASLVTPKNYEYYI